MDKKIDAQLVLDYKSGNKAALAKLVKRWHKPFCNKAYWVLKDVDLAKDIAQDSWTTIMDKVHLLKDEHSFGNWALRIVYTKSLDELRKNCRKQQKLNIYKKEIETKSIIETNNDEKLVKRNLLESINKLPAHQQMVIKLFYVESYSLKEISKMLNISIGTTKSRLFHARETLKKTFKKQKS